MERERTFSDQHIQDLTEAVYLKYGYDFSDYSIDSFRRRLEHVLFRFDIKSPSELTQRLLENDVFFNSFLEEITVNVTEMFRDPELYRMIRETLLPALSDQPLVRIWHAGCSSGEEVYSIAILLHEAGLLQKSLLYATDINQHMLQKAASCNFSVDSLPLFKANYLESGGKADFDSYYTVQNGYATFHRFFRNRMVFSPHNLVTDQSFNEFNLILCRNVLIYFNHSLQNKVMSLFFESLANSGFLVLGSKESIDNTLFGNSFQVVNRRLRVWQKKEML